MSLFIPVVVTNTRTVQVSFCHRKTIKGDKQKLSVLGHGFFICWITSHFEEFQGAAIGKKIKIKIELGPQEYQLFVLPSK